ncbi:MAG: helix-turn-helix domain-containing protein [Balneolaceae bacterium]|jgi:AraC-like DNA-binding protein
MPTFDSLDDFRAFMLSQPFDKDLSSYKSSLYPADKLLYDKHTGPYYNYILDWQTGKYEYLSEGLKKLLGYDDEFISKGIEATFEIMHPNDKEAFNKIVSKFLGLLSGASEEEINKHSVNYNFRVRKSNGVYINLLQQPVYATMDRKGNIVYDSGVVMDITRYRSDGNISLLVTGPGGERILEYYPKEEFAPRMATVRKRLEELERFATKTDHPFLRNLQQVLAVHGKDENLDVETFSRFLKVSRSQLYRKLKNALDLNPNRLIKLYRLQQSLEYLSQDEMQISEVAYHVGFHSPSYFSQCFQNEFDCTPSDYRKRVK